MFLQAFALKYESHNCTYTSLQYKASSQSSVRKGLQTFFAFKHLPHSIYLHLMYKCASTEIKFLGGAVDDVVSHMPFFLFAIEHINHIRVEEWKRPYCFLSWQESFGNEPSRTVKGVSTHACINNYTHSKNSLHESSAEWRITSEAVKSRDN